MMWYCFAIFGALFDATYYMLIKKLIQNIDLYVLASGIFLSSCIISHLRQIKIKPQTLDPLVF